MGIPESNQIKSSFRNHAFRQQFAKTFHFIQELSHPQFGQISLYQNDKIKQQLCFTKFLKSVDKQEHLIKEQIIKNFSEVQIEYFVQILDWETEADVQLLCGEIKYLKLFVEYPDYSLLKEVKKRAMDKNRFKEIDIIIILQSMIKAIQIIKNNFSFQPLLFLNKIFFSQNGIPKLFMNEFFQNESIGQQDNFNAIEMLGLTILQMGCLETEEFYFSSQKDFFQIDSVKIKESFNQLSKYYSSNFIKLIACLTSNNQEEKFQSFEQIEEFIVTNYANQVIIGSQLIDSTMKMQEIPQKFLIQSYESKVETPKRHNKIYLNQNYNKEESPISSESIILPQNYFHSQSQQTNFLQPYSQQSSNSKTQMKMDISKYNTNNIEATINSQKKANYFQPSSSFNTQEVQNQYYDQKAYNKKLNQNKSVKFDQQVFQKQYYDYNDQNKFIEPVESNLENMKIQKQNSNKQVKFGKQVVQKQYYDYNNQNKYTETIESNLDTGNKLKLSEYSQPFNFEFPTENSFKDTSIKYSHQLESNYDKYSNKSPTYSDLLAQQIQLSPILDNLINKTKELLKQSKN